MTTGTLPACSVGLSGGASSLPPHGGGAARPPAQSGGLRVLGGQPDPGNPDPLQGAWGTASPLRQT